MTLLDCKIIPVKTQGGGERSYKISKFPAVAGREILTQYPLSATPKVGEYSVNQELMLKLMSYVAVPDDKAGDIVLTSLELVNNHVPDWETLCRLEVAMIEYNCSFFANGKGSTFLESIAEKAQEFLTKTLTDSLQALSPADTQRSES